MADPDNANDGCPRVPDRLLAIGLAQRAPRRSPLGFVAEKSFNRFS